MNTLALLGLRSNEQQAATSSTDYLVLHSTTQAAGGGVGPEAGELLTGEGAEAGAGEEVVGSRREILILPQ
jgi:hypothetical protein